MTDSSHSRVIDGAMVAHYVAAVRAALADLGPEDVDDLTGGMEADLGELLAERGGSLEESLGAPEAYAAELRSAAGLPPAAATPEVRQVDVGAWLAARREGLRGLQQRHPWFAATTDFLVTLRPAWWVLRGLALATVVVAVLGIADAALVPQSAAAWLVAGVLVVLSVLFGRGVGGPRRFRRPLAVLAGVVAVPALLVAGLEPSSSDQTVYVDNGFPAGSGTGLSLDGTPVDNVYVYDRDGHRLQDVRLFGSDGRSLVLDRTTDRNDPGAVLPGRSDVYGQWWTNVFPRPWTVGGDPYGLDPQADPSSSSYVGGEQWKAPPSVAPLAPLAPSPDPSATGGTTPGGVTSGVTTGPAATSTGPAATSTVSTTSPRSPVPSTSAPSGTTTR